MTKLEKTIIDLASDNVLTREQARVYSQKIRLSWGSKSLPSWTKKEASRLLESAFLLVEAGYSSRAEDNSKNSGLAFKRAAEIFEWLSVTDPSLLSETELTLMSGLCYQIANLPAMAMGVLGKSDSTNKEAKIFMYFISGSYNRALKYCLRFHHRNSLENNINFFVIDELIRVIGLYSSYFREGEDIAFEKSFSKLESIEEFIKFEYPTLSWLLVRLTKTIMEITYENSIWKNIKPIVGELNEDGKAKLQHYVKWLNKEKQSILWPTQKKGLEKLVINESFALCTPTGSGKTLVAELSIFKDIFKKSLKFEDILLFPLILYIVPSRALASEVEYKLSKLFNRIDPFVLVTGLYGGSEWNVGEAWLTAERPTIAICTVEKAEAVLRYLGSYLLLRLTHIILDEAHQVLYEGKNSDDIELLNHDNRSLKLESFLSRVFALKNDLSVVALSAVAGGSEDYIAKWVSRNKDETAISSNLMTTRQLFGAFICRKDGSFEIRMDVLNSQKLSLSGKSTDAYIPHPFPSMPKLKGRHNDPNQYASCCSLWGAIHLSLSGKRSLISINQRINATLKLYKELFEKINNWSSACPSFFDAPEEDTTEYLLFEECLKICEDYCGSDSLEYYFLSHGIAIHHGQLPVRLRASVVTLIKAGIYKITIATSTLTEGVNLPFDNIFIPSLLRWNGDSMELLKTSEMKNLMGRAGRPGSKGEGIILVSISNESFAGVGTQKKRLHESMIKKNKKRYNKISSLIVFDDSVSELDRSPIKALIDSMAEKYLEAFPESNEKSFLIWLEEIDEEINYSDENELLVNAVDSVDQIVLASIEEIRNFNLDDLALSDIEVFLKNVWSKTYASYVVENNDFYESIFTKRARVIYEGRFGEKEKQKTIYRMGFSPRKCEQILSNSNSVIEHLNSAEDYRNWNENERYSFLLGLINKLMEIKHFGLCLDEKSWEEILKWWLIIPGSSNPDEDNVSAWLKFCGQYFDFKVGIAIGSILSSKWNVGDERIIIPDLNSWKEKTGFPWVIFWIRELLNWGTHDPVVVFILSMKICKTRNDATLKATEYLEWFSSSNTKEEDFYHPSLLNKWFRSGIKLSSKKKPRSIEFEEIELLRDFNGHLNKEFKVFPRTDGDYVYWYDPAGYLLCKCLTPNKWRIRNFLDYDFVLNPKEVKIIASKV